jgi:hypothetical protein
MGGGKKEGGIVKLERSAAAGEGNREGEGREGRREREGETGRGRERGRENKGGGDSYLQAKSTGSSPPCPSDPPS